MTIRRYADIDEAALSPAEKTLLENCEAGVPTVLGDGTLPDGPSDARNVRADLLRYLICGGCEAWPVADWGVDLTGAYVTGTLDLDFATAKGLTGLVACRFENPIEALQARFEVLALNGSHLPGLMAQGARVQGNVFLHSVSVRGMVRLIGARISGQLNCECARFSNSDGPALDLESAEVAGHVSLRRIKADGEVRLSGARIGGQLICKGAQILNGGDVALSANHMQVAGGLFLNVEWTDEDKVSFRAEGEVNLSGARIGGQLVCKGAQFSNVGRLAFNAQKLTVEEFIWMEVGSVVGMVALNGARCCEFIDDKQSWDKVEVLVLNGLVYNHLHGSMDTRMRLAWLAKDAATAQEFRPQPYEHLASVYRAMGHTSDARLVLLEKDILLAADWTRRAVEEQADLRQRRDATPMPADHHEIQNRLARLWLDLRILPVWHWFLRYLVGYGHAPQRVLYWTAGTITVMGLFYLCVWKFGGMVPNSDIILTSPHWAEAMAANPDLPGMAWEASEVGQHYQTFAAATYAADVFIPLVDLGQEAAWTATTATRLGGLAWVATWFLKLFGWIVTAVGGAAITGIIRRE